MTDSIDRLLAYQIQSRHFPGALVHMERAGKVLAHQVAGRIGPDSDVPMHEAALFRLASLTKSIVTVAALMQVDEGSLALDAPIADYLPEFAAVHMSSGARPDRAPTVRDLMRHTSGLAYHWEVPEAHLRERSTQSPFVARMPCIDARAFVRDLAALPLMAQPGTRFQYGYSSDVLGMIVEKIDGVTLGQALRKRLFDPLGMRETGFEVPAAEHARLATAYAADTAWHAMVPGYGMRKAGQPWMESGGGGLVATIGDYINFARMVANGGGVGRERLLSKTLFVDMSRNQLPDGVDGPYAYTGPGFGFGLGLAVRHDWGSAAMPCFPGEMTWSGISGTALFVHPGEEWFAVAFTSNMATRMMARMEFRRAAALL